MALECDGEKERARDESMKICIIENIYPPYDRGGAEQVVRMMVEWLRARGHEVVIITSSPDGESVERSAGLTIYRRKPLNLFFYTNAHHHSMAIRFLWHVIDMFHVPIARWVTRILMEEKPEIVHTHNLMGLSFCIPRAIRRLGLRHIHTVHDVQLVEPSAMILKQVEGSWRYHGLPTRLYTQLMRALMGSPDIVISPSQFLLDFYRSRGFFPHSRMVVLRNPVTFAGAGASLRQNDSPVSRPMRFLYIGQIEHHKGIQFLIDTFRLWFEATHPMAELHVVGSGSLLSQIRDEVKRIGAIVVHGRMDRASLPELFRSMDVTVVPSLCYENSPTVIFESFAFGVPVLASRVEGIVELIQEGHNGMTFETGEYESLTEKLSWCVEHREAIATMGAEARATLPGPSYEGYIDALVSLYQDGSSVDGVEVEPARR